MNDHRSTADHLDELPAIVMPGMLRAVIEIPAGTVEKRQYDPATNTFPIDERNGVPRRMMAYMFRASKDQHNVSKTCVLPDGVPLPEAGYYIYKYDGPKGWQLEGTQPLPVEQKSSQNIPDAAMKLA